MTPTSVQLGGKTFPIERLPFARLRTAMSAINRIGAAASKGVYDDATADAMSTVLCAGLNVDLAELDALPTTLGEIERAFEAIVKITGYEEAIEKALAQARKTTEPASPNLAQQA